MKPLRPTVLKLCWIIPTFLILQCSNSNNSGKKKSTASAGNAAKTDLSEEESGDEEIEEPKTVEKSQTSSKKSATPPATDPSPAAQPTEPAPPPKNNPNVLKGTYLVNIACTDLLEFTVRISSDTVSRTITAPKTCSALMTALNDKTFPLGNTVESLVGGPTMKAQCDNGTLQLSVVSIQSGGSGDTTISFSLNNIPVCQEIRNSINALKL